MMSARFVGFMILIATSSMMSSSASSECLIMIDDVPKLLRESSVHRALRVQAGREISDLHERPGGERSQTRWRESRRACRLRHPIVVWLAAMAAQADSRTR
jgi:hypothetical protein